MKNPFAIQDITPMGQALNTLVQTFIETPIDEVKAIQIGGLGYFAQNNVLEVSLPRGIGKTKIIQVVSAWDMVQRNIFVVSKNAFMVDTLKRSLNGIYSMSMLNDRVNTAQSFIGKIRGTRFDDPRGMLIICDEVDDDPIDMIVDTIFSAAEPQYMKNVKLVSLRT